MRLTEVLAKYGFASQLDLRQAQDLVGTAAESIPDFERQIQQQEDLISNLLGQNPGAIPRGLPLTQQPAPSAVPPGLPSPPKPCFCLLSLTPPWKKRRPCWEWVVPARHDCSIGSAKGWNRSVFPAVVGAVGGGL